MAFPASAVSIVDETNHIATVGSATTSVTAISGESNSCSAIFSSRRKLKESCTDCAIAKVKCTREKPTCQRCARRGRPCEYAKSRRNGRSSLVNNVSLVKPSDGPKSGNAQPWQQNRTSLSDSSQPSGSVQRRQEQPDANSWPLWDAESTTDFFGSEQSASHPPWAQADHFNRLSATEAGITWDDFGAPSCKMNPHLAQLELDALLGRLPSDDGTTADKGMASTTEEMNSYFPELDNSSSTTWMFDAVTDPVASGISNSLPARGFDARSGAGSVSDSNYASMASDAIMTLPHSDADPNGISEDNCLAKATATLLTLFPQAKATSSPVLTFETALRTSRRGIGTLTSILSCPCSKDRYLVFLLAIILHKIMSWYRAISIGTDPDAILPPDVVQVHLTGRHAQFSGEIVPRTGNVDATAIGNSSKDFEGPQEQERRAAQLVMGELYQVRRLLCLFSLRLGETMMQQDSAYASPSGSLMGDQHVSMTDIRDASVRAFANTANSAAAAATGTTTAINSQTSSEMSGTVFNSLDTELQRCFRAVSGATIERLRTI